MTVAELIAKLQKFPPDAKVTALGTDCENDAVWKTDIDVRRDREGRVYVEGDGVPLRFI